MEHHAYLVIGPLEEGRAAALYAAAIVLGKSDLSKKAKAKHTNPDIIDASYGLFSVEDARTVYRLALQRPFAGEKKAVVISASRIYHEAQNALLKLFEEPPADTILYLCVPFAGSIISTLRSRLVPLPGFEAKTSEISENAREFLALSKEKRSVMIKKLADAQGEDKKRAARDAALAILDGVERTIYEKWVSEKPQNKDATLTALLEDVSQLRSYLHDRSAPLRMILEHISLTVPRDL